MTIASTGARTQLDAIQRTADDLADLLDGFRPDGPLQHLAVTSARNYVAAVNAALERLNDSIRRDLT